MTLDTMTRRRAPHGRRDDTRRLPALRRTALGALGASAPALVATLLLGLTACTIVQRPGAPTTVYLGVVPHDCQARSR